MRRIEVQTTSSFFFIFHKAPLPIASPEFIMNLRARISLQSGDCQDKICLKQPHAYQLTPSDVVTHNSRYSFRVVLVGLPFPSYLCYGQDRTARLPSQAYSSHDLSAQSWCSTTTRQITYAAIRPDTMSIRYTR